MNTIYSARACLKFPLVLAGVDLPYLMNRPDISAADQFAEGYLHQNWRLLPMSEDAVPCEAQCSMRVAEQTQALHIFIRRKDPSRATRLPDVLLVAAIILCSILAGWKVCNQMFYMLSLGDLVW